MVWSTRAGYAHLVPTPHLLYVSLNISMFLLHTCRTQKHSHRHLYVHSLPKHQCTHSHAHTPSYTNTHVLAAHIQVHTHSYYTCAPTATTHPHEHTQGSAICTPFLNPYSHMPISVRFTLEFHTHPCTQANKTYICKYICKHTHVSTKQSA